MDLLSATAGPERVILGGRYGEEPVAISHRRLDQFRALGGRVIETAHSYAGGAAETVIGRWVRDRRCRDDVVIVDKVCHPREDGASRVRPDVIQEELVTLLTRLRLEEIDLVLLHRDDPAISVSDLVETLMDEVEKGRVRRFGVSNWPIDRMRMFVAMARAAGHAPVVSYQYSLAVPTRQIWPGARHADAEILRVVQGHDVPLLAWAAQARGWFARGAEAETVSTISTPEHEPSDPFQSEANRRVRRQCDAVAERYGVPATTMALAWTLHQPTRVWTAVGPATEEELIASMAAATLTLSADDLALLSTVDRADPGGVIRS